ncbi:MAG: hypothetical protein IKF36_01395 [Bacilli bacterium]|nr:hypothetical protein [Bacilli bacterium]
MRLKKWVQNLLAINIVLSLMIIGSIFDSIVSLTYTILPMILMILSGLMLYKWGSFDE